MSAWRYTPLQQMCAADSLPDYMRDVDFSPRRLILRVRLDRVRAAVRAGRRRVCATRRPGSRPRTSHPTRPTWINYTGGDTLHSVAVTDLAVYVQGHQRWLDNPNGRDYAGPGAVSRPGIGAIDPTTGKALSWNPTKTAASAARTSWSPRAGLWVASDTAHIGHETHMRIALLP